MIVKYDPRESKKSLNEVRNLMARTLLDGSFQRLGGVDSGSGWRYTDSREYVYGLIHGTVYNRIILADAESCLRHAREEHDVKSIEYFEKVKERDLAYVSIDGNNTTSTVTAFLNNHDKVFYVNENDKKQYFKDFSREDQEAIRYEEKLDVTILHKIGIDDMCDLFRSLNKSTKLNAQEHRQARCTPLSSFVRESSNGAMAQFFKDLIFSNSDNLDKRSHEEMVAQLCLKIQNDGDLKKVHLDKFYDNNRYLDAGTEKSIQYIISESLKLVGSALSRRLNKGQLLTFWQLLLTVKKNKLKIVDAKGFFDWFLTQDTKFSQTGDEVPAGESEDKAYKTWLKFYNKEECYQKIDRLFELYLLKEADNLTKDNIISVTRSNSDRFTFEDKLEMWRKQNGLTRDGEEIKILELYMGGIFEADHVVPVIHGGETSINNGELKTKTANRKKGSKIEEPYFEHQQEQAI